MPMYVFAYHGGPHFATREDGAAYQQKWRAWESDVEGAVVDASRYLSAPQTVSAEGVTSIEVAEIMEMSM